LHQAGVDLMVAAGGLEADAMKLVLHGSAIPSVVLYANSIVERSLVDARADPGWEVTGIDNLNAELSGKRLELLHALAPSAKRILILYYPNIDPSRIGVEQARRAAANLGLKIDARAVESRGDIERTMRALQSGEVDAMLTVPNAPIDNALRQLILPTVRKLRLPLMVHSRSLAEEGAVASYGATQYGIGEQAARLASKVLNGVSASKIPFEIPKRFVYTVNTTALREFKLELGPLTKSQVHDFVTTTGV
jgi:putative ABC transport system substrate-binding protein